MKRVLIMVILMCFTLSLVGCGSSSNSERDNDNSMKKKSEKSAKDSDSESVQEDSKETSITTDLGMGLGEVEVKTGDSIVWDAEKMGGMPQPEGVTVIMEMDMTGILGKTSAYTYGVSGLTKEGYQAYIKLVAETYPTVLEDSFTETGGSFMGTTENYEQQFIVTYMEGSQSTIQYIN